MDAPDIGLDCPLTPEIRRVSNEFAAPGPDDGPREGDDIIELQGRPVDDWQHLMRRLDSLRSATFEEIPLQGEGPSGHSATLQAALDNPGLTAVRLDGKDWVRVGFRRSSTGTGPLAACWRRVGTPGLAVVFPSVLWFLLKLGLFVVGAIVFWKRPEDHSAPQFFILCLVTIGAYIGGYNWLYIVTQPVLLPIFMACAVLLPAVSLHFYLLFPRPKDVVLRRPKAVLAAIYGPPLLFLAAMLACYVALRICTIRTTPRPRSKGVGDVFRADRLGVLYAGRSRVPGLRRIPAAQLPPCRGPHGTQPGEVDPARRRGRPGADRLLALSDATSTSGPLGGGRSPGPMFAASVCLTVAFTISITRYRLMQLDQIHLLGRRLLPHELPRRACLLRTGLSSAW